MSDLCLSLQLLGISILLWSINLSIQQVAKAISTDRNGGK